MTLAASLSGLYLSIPLLAILLCAVALAIGDRRYLRRRTHGRMLSVTPSRYRLGVDSPEKRGPRGGSRRAS